MAMSVTIGALLFAATVLPPHTGGRAPRRRKGDPAPEPLPEHPAFTRTMLVASVAAVTSMIPQGLALMTTISFAVAALKLAREQVLIQEQPAVEILARVDVVCVDKTGTLTQNVMTVVAGSVGIHCKFVHRLEENLTRTNADEEPGVKGASSKHTQDFSIDQEHINSSLSPAIQDLFNKAVSINSTAFEDRDPDTQELVFVGSKTETALLKFAKENSWAHYKDTRDAADIVQMIPFSSERKAMGVVVRLGGGRCRLYLKGASEILTKRCTQHVIVSKPGAAHPDDIETKEIDELASDNISRTIIFYANQTLRTIAMCYRDFESWPPKGIQVTNSDEVRLHTVYLIDHSNIGPGSIRGNRARAHTHRHCRYRGPSPRRCS